MKIIGVEKRKLTDHVGNTCATFHSRSDGKIEIRDKTDHWRGTYDPKSDRTYDPRGNLIGGGNWLAPSRWRGMELVTTKASRPPPLAGRAEFVFPARGSSGHLTQFAGDGLPVFTNSLRHVYRSIAKEVKVDDVAARLLMGHSLRGVSEGYISRIMLSGGPSLRAA